MKSFEFKTAIRNAMKGTGGSGATRQEAALAVTAPGPLTWKRRVWRLVRGPFVLGRRFLVGGLLGQVEALHKRMDHVTQRLDGLYPKADVAAAQIAQSLRAADELRAATNDLRKMLDQRLQPLDALDGRLHQLDIKIRGPIDYDPDTRALRTVDGYLLVPKAARELSVLLADAPAEGLEPGTHRCLKTLIDPGMTVIDVGASVGMLSLCFARSVGASGQVHAFEAEPDYQDLLAKAFALNGVPWVTLHCKAAGREEGRATFHVSPIAGHSSLYDLPEAGASTKAIDVEVTTLDNALGDLPAIDLVKIDVEGAELDVLAGMTNVIAKNPDMAIVAEFGPSHLSRVGLSIEDWFDAFYEHGYEAYAIDEATGACRQTSPRQVHDVVSVNILFVRPGSVMQQRAERLGASF